MNPRLRLDHLLYGADYNPEQWLAYPGVLDEDLRLMRLSHTSVLAVGIFSWASLEPEEGRYEFGWLDERMDALHKNGQKVILATPSGGKPNWMAKKYEEIRRIDDRGRREPQNGRHNHCMTSPIYRAKVREMNAKLAERYGDHPALALWHLSNEYGGYCYCPLCLTAFQEWLRARYGTLEALNDAWWTKFWSHTFTEWDQITTIDATANGLNLDWKRFMTEQVADFIRAEAEPLRRITPDVPVTANFMAFFRDYDYHRLAEEIDVVSWDAYPEWHATPDDSDPAVWTAFLHDSFRAMKPDRPWLLMECTPSVTNWRAASRPKRPGLHELTALQAIAHGSDGVMHFQFRKSRGSCEQHHGAFVDHTGDENTRVFREVAATGATVADLSEMAGLVEPARAAVVFDWPTWWAIDDSFGPRNAEKRYPETCTSWYRSLWERGGPTHVICADKPLGDYRLVIAPMLYMVTEDRAKRLKQFVERGGTLIATYLTGWVNETTAAHRTGFPGHLRDLFGICAEEMDVLHDHTPQAIEIVDPRDTSLAGVYSVQQYAEVIHPEGCEILGRYTHDFYAGGPAVTRMAFGEGVAYFVAGRAEKRLMDDLVGGLVERLELGGDAIEHGPQVSVQRRGELTFVMNFGATATEVRWNASEFSPRSGAENQGMATLEPYGSIVLRAR